MPMDHVKGTLLLAPRRHTVGSVPAAAVAAPSPTVAAPSPITPIHGRTEHHAADQTARKTDAKAAVAAVVAAAGVDDRGGRLLDDHLRLLLNDHLGRRWWRHHHLHRLLHHLRLLHHHLRLPRGHRDLHLERLARVEALWDLHLHEPRRCLHLDHHAAHHALRYLH